jgi:hypothetical protein
MPPRLRASRRPASPCSRFAGRLTRPQASQYRVALDSGADPAVVGQWITESRVRERGGRWRAEVAALSAVEGSGDGFAYVCLRGLRV